MRHQYASAMIQGNEPAAHSEDFLEAKTISTPTQQSRRVRR